MKKNQYIQLEVYLFWYTPVDKTLDAVEDEELI